MQKAKRNIALRVLAGLLGLWLVFFGGFSVWELHSTRDSLLGQANQNMEQLTSYIEQLYLTHWDDQPQSGLELEVQPLDVVRAQVTDNLVAYKASEELELACYDEKLNLFASTESASISVDYTVEPTGKRVMGMRYPGILNIDEILPEDAAETLKYYASYNPGEFSDEIGYLNGYSIFYVGLWSDGANLIPRKIVVTEERITEETIKGYYSPQFDKDGNMIEAGNQEIVWEYINEPAEEIIRDMVYCPDATWDFGVGRPGLVKSYPELLEKVLDADNVREVYGHGLMEEPGYVEDLGSGQMVASGGFAVTEYFGYWDSSILYSYRQTSQTSLMSMGGVYSAPILVAAGRVYPLKECTDVLASVGAGSFLLFLTVAAILIWQLTGVYEKQVQLETQRRRTTNAMAHDLKTPMAAIVGYAENLLENTHPDKQEKYLRSIYCQVGRMNETVGKMLELSRLEAEADRLELREFSLTELCRETAEDCLGDEVRFLIQGDAVITADRAMMRRVLENFLSNARKHTPPGGIIRIELEKGKCRVYNPGNSVPTAELPRLWEAHYQADASRSQGGSGLGLSIVREILNRHGFEYGVDNMDDGVIFWFSF